MQYDPVDQSTQYDPVDQNMQCISEGDVMLCIRTSRDKCAPLHNGRVGRYTVRRQVALLSKCHENKSANYRPVLNNSVHSMYLSALTLAERYFKFLLSEMHIWKLAPPAASIFKKFIYLSIQQASYPPINPSTHPPTYQSTDLSMHPSVSHPSYHPFI